VAKWGCHAAVVTTQIDFPSARAVAGVGRWRPAFQFPSSRRCGIMGRHLVYDGDGKIYPLGGSRMCRFSLRHVLVVVTLLAIGLGYVKARNDVTAERAALAEIEDLGGWVTYLVPTVKADEFDIDTDPPGPGWLRDFLGDAFFSEGIAIEFNYTSLSASLSSDGGSVSTWGSSDFTDERATLLKRIRKLVVIDVTETALTDGCIAQLRSELTDCQIDYDRSREQ